MIVGIVYLTYLSILLTLVYMMAKEIENIQEEKFFDVGFDQGRASVIDSIKNNSTNTGNDHLKPID